MNDTVDTGAAADTGAADTTPAAVDGDGGAPDLTSTVLTDGVDTSGESTTGADGADTGDNGGTDDGNLTGATENYADFSLPEGMTMDETTLDTAVELFKADGLDQEQAQKYVDLYAKHVQAWHNS